MTSNALEIKIAAEAESEIKDIYQWYFDQSPPAANSFLEALDLLFNFLIINPYSFSRQRKNFRVAYTKRFPFAIIYEIMGTTILILRILHTSRHPRKRFTKLKR